MFCTVCLSVCSFQRELSFSFSMRVRWIWFSVTLWLFYSYDLKLLFFLLYLMSTCGMTLK